MSLKCTQTKVFAPETRQHSEDRTAFGTTRACIQMKGKLKNNPRQFKGFPVSFFFYLLSLVVMDSESKAIYQLILLAHRVLLPRWSSERRARVGEERERCMA